LVEHGELQLLLDSNWCLRRDFDCSALEFVKQGCSALILHYLGDAETEAEVKSLTALVEEQGVQTVAVAGDIALFETTTKVSEKHRPRSGAHLL